jgi:hypothetical protein
MLTDKKMVPRLVEQYKAGKFPIDRLSRVYESKDIEVAVEDMKAGKVRSRSCLSSVGSSSTDSHLGHKTSSRIQTFS